MNKRTRVAAIREIVGGPPFFWTAASMGTLAVVRVVERLLLAAALFAATGDLAHGLLLGAATGALHVAHSLIATHLRIAARTTVETRGAAAILAADAMKPLEGGENDVFATFLEGTELIVRFLVDLVPGALGDAAAAVVLLVVVARFARAEDFALFCAIALVGAVMALAARRATAAHAARAWEANGPFWQQLRAVLGARLEIVASGVTEASERELAARVHRWADAERRYRLMAGSTGRLPVLVVGLGLALASLARWHHGIDGELLRETSLFAGVGAPLAGVVATLHEAAKSETAIGRFLAMTSPSARSVRADQRADPSTSRVALLGSPRELVAHEIAYRYAGADSDALVGASFAWRRGRILAVAGDNGAGKSTLLRLLLRLDEPTSGRFEVDGKAWKTIDDVSWRRSVAYVAQDPYLDEAMSVRDVSRLLAPEADDGSLERALRRVGIWERLAREPAPLGTPLRLLSAGMRQRVVLARALAQDRPILVLDEPDASLDGGGVAQLVTLLRELARERLVAVVAHSLVLLDAADDRVVLSAGPRRDKPESQRRDARSSS